MLKAKQMSKLQINNFYELRSFVAGLPQIQLTKAFQIMFHELAFDHVEIYIINEPTIEYLIVKLMNKTVDNYCISVEVPEEGELQLHTHTKIDDKNALFSQDYVTLKLKQMLEFNQTLQVPGKKRSK